jgi:hypothetical protein
MEVGAEDVRDAVVAGGLGPADLDRAEGARLLCSMRMEAKRVHGR